MKTIKQYARSWVRKNGDVDNCPGIRRAAAGDGLAVCSSTMHAVLTPLSLSGRGPKICCYCAAGLDMNTAMAMTEVPVVHVPRKMFVPDHPDFAPAILSERAKIDAERRARAILLMLMALMPTRSLCLDILALVGDH